MTIPEVWDELSLSDKRGVCRKDKLRDDLNTAAFYSIQGFTKKNFFTKKAQHEFTKKVCKDKKFALRKR